MTKDGFIFIGDIAEVVNNPDNIYEGDLRYYFNIVFNHATNLKNPYHNFRHMMFVTRMCFLACKYYKEILTKRKMRNLLIAAIFHDFDHFGRHITDRENIKVAIKALDELILEEDRPCFDEISICIDSTEYPHQYRDNESLSAQILRDADMMQVFDKSWIQQVVFGFSLEWGTNPKKVLADQLPFLNKLEFDTEWAQQLITKDVIKEKIKEVQSLIEILRIQ